MRTILLALALGLTTLGTSSCGGSGGASTSSGASQVGMIVTGSASNGVSIAYGSDSTSYTGHFPLHVRLPVASVGYYYLSARLKNGGTLTCKLTIGNASSVSHARGGHKTCSAKLTNNYQVAGTRHPAWASVRE